MLSSLAIRWVRQTGLEGTLSRLLVAAQKLPDPLDYLGLWFPKGAIFDYTNYNNATVNTDLAKAIGTYNPAQRAKLITAAQAIYMHDYIVIPVVNPYEALFLNHSITGATASFAYIYEPSLAMLGSAK